MGISENILDLILEVSRKNYQPHQFRQLTKNTNNKISKILDAKASVSFFLEDGAFETLGGRIKNTLPGWNQNEKRLKAALRTVSQVSLFSYEDLLNLGLVENESLRGDWLLVLPVKSNRVFFGWMVLRLKTKPEVADLTPLQVLVQTMGNLFQSQKKGKDLELLETRYKLNSLLQEDIDSLKPTHLIANSCPIISQFFKAERTTFFAYNSGDNKLHSIHAQKLTKGTDITLETDQGLVGTCYSSLKTFYSNDPYQREDFFRNVDQSSGFKTKNALVTPLVVGDSTFGVLQVLNKKGGFTREDVKNIKLIAISLASHLNTYRFMKGSSAAQVELESLLETIPEVLYRLDDEGLFQFVSQDILKWGYFREELVGTHFSEIIHSEDLRQVARDWVLPNYIGKVTGDKGAPGLFDERRSGKRGTKRVKIRIKPGPHIVYDDLYPGLSDESEKVFYTEVNASGYWINDFSSRPAFVGTIGIISDVTERHFAEKRLESAQQNLIRAERFAGLGTLAAGIAHDFNNILTAIGLSSDICHALISSGQSGDDLLFNLNTISDYVQKASDLTGRLLSLGRSNVPKIEPTTIEQIFEEALGIMQHQLASKGIGLVSDIIGDIPPCMLDKGQLRDVIINLATNSMHSMEEKLIENPGFHGSMNLSILATRVDSNIIIKVSDTGLGIDEETLPRMFDPFFTTKNRDSRKGTGLGLAMVFSVVKNHGGYIEVETITNSSIKRMKNPSIHQTGTTITMTIPINVAQQLDFDIIDDQISPPVFTDAEIYVVDDERSIVDLITTILRSVGYHNIHSYYNGTEVLGAIRTKRHLPHLIITDVQMPPLDGVNLVQAITFEFPERCPKFIVISGKLSTEYVSEFEKLGVNRFIKKPCKSKELLNHVNQSLQKHSHSPKTM